MEAVLSRSLVLKVPPQLYSSSEFCPVIWNTPMLAERRSPSRLPALVAICSARTRASSVALLIISIFSSPSLV